MNFFNLNCLTNSYNHHFMFYNQDRKNVTRFIPNKVWKIVYVDYKLKYPNFTSQEEILKYKL